MVDVDVILEADTVAAALRHLRRRAQLSSTELARKAGFSQSKVSRIENGHTRASREDLQELAAALDLSDDAKAQLTALANESAGADSALAPADVRFEIRERDATSRVTYSPSLIPPILQLPLYTKELLHQLEEIHRSGGYSANLKVRSAVEERARRQLTLDERPYVVYLRERCLTPSWASPEVRHIQRMHILNMAQHPGLTVRMVRDDIDDLLPGLEEFTYLSFSDDQAAVISETYSGASYYEADHIVGRYESMLHRIAGLSYDVQLELEIKTFA